MFKKILFVTLLFCSNAFALDVCGKQYYSNIQGKEYEIAFMCGPFSPIWYGNAYIIQNEIVVAVHDFHQNNNDSIVNLGDFGVFYQSPSDVLTFIPPPFMVFNLR